MLVLPAVKAFTQLISTSDLPSWREFCGTVDTLLWYAENTSNLCLSQSLNSADAILNSRLRVPLLGAAIGNGWIDPKRHYPSYLDFAVKVGILEENSPVRVDLVSEIPAQMLTPHPGIQTCQTGNRRMR